MATVSTSTTPLATAFGSQRKVDRTANGVLWTMYDYYGKATNGTFGMSFAYSTDRATWSDGGFFSNASNSSAITHQRNGSFFIDQDDFAHAVFKDNGNGYLYYRRGTPNAARTAYTWSANTAIHSATAADFPDIVAHREGTGWVAHIVYTLSGTVQHKRVDITSAGVITAGSAVAVSAAYGTTVQTYPSIDFHHTGDSKTVKDGLPHLFIGWSAGSAVAGRGIRFKKGTYSAGNWTFGTEREIDATHFADNNSNLNTMWDGRYVMLAGALTDGSAFDIVAYERDEADTTTTARVLLDNAVAGQLNAGSVTYDHHYNLHVFSSYGKGGSQYGLHRRTWIRSTNTLTAATDLGATTANVLGTGAITSRRGSHGNRVDWAFTNGTASPYTVVHDSLEVAPVTTGYYVPAIML